MTNRYHTDAQGKIEIIKYNPGYQDSGDLELTTKTVSTVVQPVIADYQADLTVPAPADSRFIVKRVGMRVAITVDSMTAGHLYGAVMVDGVERQTFDITGTGTAYIVTDLTEGQFGLGVATEYEIMLWVDAGQAVISQCRVWQGVGSTNNEYDHPMCLKIKHTGMIQLLAELKTIGNGPIDVRIGQGTCGRPSFWSNQALSTHNPITPPIMAGSNIGISLRATQNGDLVCFYVFGDTITAILLV